LIEEKLKKPATTEGRTTAAVPTLEDMQQESSNLRRLADALNESAEGITGAAAAAGVLTAVDEDEEGDEEADVPREFEYFSDGEEEDEEQL
jgi:26S proteasome regulatory subunit N2